MTNNTGSRLPRRHSNCYKSISLHYHILQVVVLMTNLVFYLVVEVIRNSLPWLHSNNKVLTLRVTCNLQHWLIIINKLVLTASQCSLHPLSHSPSNKTYHNQQLKLVPVVHKLHNSLFNKLPHLKLTLSMRNLLHLVESMSTLRISYSQCRHTSMQSK